MNNNRLAYASLQIGLGIICLLMGISDLFQRRELVLDAFVILIGINGIIYGWLASRNQKIDDHRNLSMIVTGLAIIASALIIFRFFTR